MDPNYLKETLRTANQAFEAGAKASNDASARKLRRLILEVETACKWLDEGVAPLPVIEGLRRAIEDARS